eukprot:CAMPEP_0118962986 /NCGR_PEP_ID=MMETSP1173-20130426/1100_1 /TAXON_ID=1034831 /ORGANISM="Rhizochromulina marina cf, Strain CCMP1243" /LENGTH=347 /DNA_ID=CAMNT_0006911297 /DNA_START=15 /DNA_END=1058 /DNA_ORIENTATION=-
MMRGPARHAALVVAACAASSLSSPSSALRPSNPGHKRVLRIASQILGRQRLAFCSQAEGDQGAAGSPPPSSLRVALCQMLSGADKAANVKTAGGMVREAAAGGAELVVLPECWNSPYDTSAFPAYAEPIPGETSRMMSSLAKECNVWLIGGSIPERDGDKVYNTCLVFDPEGRIVAKHRKVHLFDIDLPGKITFRESDILHAGDQATVFQSPFGTIGVGICYDIRFPELAMLMRNRGAKIIVYPGAFNLTTGPAHWELLQRARALDNQAFVLTASPARNPDASYQAWGHSSVVSPWGDVVASTDHTPGIVFASLDLANVQEVRAGIPVSNQRRSDVYSLEDRSEKKA